MIQNSPKWWQRRPRIYNDFVLSVGVITYNEEM